MIKNLCILIVPSLSQIARAGLMQFLCPSCFRGFSSIICRGQSALQCYSVNRNLQLLLLRAQSPVRLMATTKPRTKIAADLTEANTVELKSTVEANIDEISERTQSSVTNQEQLSKNVSIIARENTKAAILASVIEQIGSEAKTKFVEGSSKPQKPSKKTSAQTTVTKRKKTPSSVDPKSLKNINESVQEKKNSYGLIPGTSPFPDFPMPTFEAAYEVSRLLSKEHGELVMPSPRKGSFDDAEHGRASRVIDALIRTVLSAATNGRNSSNAYAGLLERFGEMHNARKRVNWNSVREASLEEVELSIRRGGLSNAKSKNIKKILDIVYEKNKLQRQQKPVRAGAIDEDLSLEYMHDLNTEDAMNEMLQLPGVGPKTASCVTLFCLKRPSFAVDTHVFRLCKWLGWVPSYADRTQTFSHCDVRIPDELKYGLHYNFIQHGRTCPRCRAAVGNKSKAWADAKCPIEHLVTRTGARKQVQEL